MYMYYKTKDIGSVHHKIFVKFVIYSFITTDFIYMYVRVTTGILYNAAKLD